MKIEPYLVSIATNFLKRILDPHYDRLSWHRTVQDIRSRPKNERMLIETLLYSVAAFVEVHTSGHTSVREVLKRLFEDGASEIGSRIMNRPLIPTEEPPQRSPLFPEWIDMLDHATRHLKKPLF